MTLCHFTFKIFFLDTLQLSPITFDQIRYCFYLYIFSLSLSFFSATIIIWDINILIFRLICKRILIILYYLRLATLTPGFTFACCSLLACLSSCFLSFFSRLSLSLRSISSGGIGSPEQVCGWALCAGRPGPFFVFSFFRHLARRFWNHTWKEETNIMNVGYSDIDFQYLFKKLKF